MTEFELIAVAKNCGNRYTDCSECPLDETEDCLQHLAVQLAERLEEAGNRLTEFRELIRAEAIKEYVQNLKDRTDFYQTAGTSSFIEGCIETKEWYDTQIDEIAAEMAGAE